MNNIELVEYILSNSVTYPIIVLNGIKLTNSELVFKFYKDKLKDKNQEYFYCVYLDTSKKVISDKLLFIGTINYSLVHPREVFKEAYLNGASAIICIHNHPSGDVSPSKEDILLTIKIKEIGIIHGINLIDHVIIGDNSYYSFYDNGQIYRYYEGNAKGG